VIYICIPVLDEAPTIGVLLWRIRQVMTEFRRDFHLVVLDDGSTDATAEVLRPYEKVLPLTLLRNERTTGYAAALERLLRDVAARSTHPKRDIAVVLQADFTEPPEEIPSLVKKLEGGADVVGSAVSGVDAELPRGMRWSRRGLPWLLGRSRLPKEGGDPLSGFRAYRVHVLRRAMQEREGKPLLTRQGWAANAELLMAVAPHARRADQAPVELRYGRRQRETRFDPWPTLREAWALRRTGGPRLAKQAAAPAAPPSASAQPAATEPRTEAEAPRRPRPEQTESLPGQADSEQRRAEPEQPRRQRPPRPPRQERLAVAPAEGLAPVAGTAAPQVDTDGTEVGQPVERKRQRPRRPRNRKPKTEGTQPQAEAPSQAEAPPVESAAGGEPRARRRPPRRNRKRGRREGNTPEGTGE
jgi:Glycosyl transferase family 2